MIERSVFYRDDRRSRSGWLRLEIVSGEDEHEEPHPEIGWVVRVTFDNPDVGRRSSLTAHADLQDAIADFSQLRAQFGRQQMTEMETDSERALPPESNNWQRGRCEGTRDVPAQGPYALLRDEWALWLQAPLAGAMEALLLARHGERTGVVEIPAAGIGSGAAVWVGRSRSRSRCCDSDVVMAVREGGETFACYAHDLASPKYARVPNFEAEPRPRASTERPVDLGGVEYDRLRAPGVLVGASGYHIPWLDADGNPRAWERLERFAIPAPIRYGRRGERGLVSFDPTAPGLVRPIEERAPELTELWLWKKLSERVFSQQTRVLL